VKMWLRLQTLLMHYDALLHFPVETLLLQSVRSPLQNIVENSIKYTGQ